MTDPLDDAIDALPTQAATLFRAVRASDDYSCKAGKMQMMIRFRGESVGGLTPRASEWYFSKVFLANHDGHSAAEARGFRRVDKLQSGKKPHTYWTLIGADAVTRFRDVVEEITGVPLSGPSDPQG